MKEQRVPQNSTVFCSGMTVVMLKLWIWLLYVKDGWGFFTHMDGVIGRPRLAQS